MIELEIQNPCRFEIPNSVDLQNWAEAAIQEEGKEFSLVIRFVDEEEGIDLNHTYRHKKSATNVLSFPYEAPDYYVEIPELVDEPAHLGDLVLCEPVVLNEAAEQNKALQQHWAHLVIHGVLHLQGYDHLTVEDAIIMESLEIKILEQLGFNNPYSNA